MNSIDNAVLNALFNREQEIAVTTAAIILKIKQNHNYTLDEEDIGFAITGLINQGMVRLVKNSQDKDAFELTEAARQELLGNNMSQNKDIASLATALTDSDHSQTAYETDEVKRQAALQQMKEAGAIFGDTAQADPDAILVVRVHDSDVEASMKSNYDQGREKIANLNNLFAVGCMHADYEITAKLPAEEVNNSTGYFDPLASATFVCHDGEIVAAGKTVRFLDERTHRRLYIIVVVPGMNVIVHDRYSFTENGFAGVLACTSDVSGAREFIGMEPVWSEGCQYDFVMACRLFGFEYDRSKNEVYMPRERKQNFFVSMQSFFFNAIQRYAKKQEMLNK